MQYYQANVKKFTLNNETLYVVECTDRILDDDQSQSGNLLDDEEYDVNGKSYEEYKEVGHRNSNN